LRWFYPLFRREFNRIKMVILASRFVGLKVPEIGDTPRGKLLLRLTVSILAALMTSREEIIEALKTVEDPELFLDIWFLGLIYSIDQDEAGKVKIDMTFTSALCPAGPLLVNQVKEKVGALPGVTEVDVTIVFSPPWQPSEEVRLLLGLS